MSKTALLFAGQGAQKPGMGRSLTEQSPEAAAILKKAGSVCGNIEYMCTSMPAGELNQTINTQPAVFAVDMMAWSAFQSLGVEVSAMAGFSLGEYAALAASGVMEFERVMELVIRRAQWMQECAESYPGGMAAVLGTDEETINEIIHIIHTSDVLLPVNFNCPGQTVVAGELNALDAFIGACKEKKIRTVRLPVNGAFHTSLMREAAEKIGAFLHSVTLAEPEVTLYSNVTGLPYETQGMKERIAEQTMRPVQFQKMIEHMIQSGITRFVEVGPGRTLSGLVRRIDKSVSVYNVSDQETLEKTADELK